LKNNNSLPGECVIYLTAVEPGGTTMIKLTKRLFFLLVILLTTGGTLLMASNNHIDTDKLLKTANRLLYKNSRQVTTRLLKSMFPEVIDEKRYNEALLIYRKVLELAPENGEAHYGVKACTDMLEPYLAVQHIAPPDFNAMNQEDPLAVLKKPDAKSMLPWEVRRMILDDMLDFDMKAIDYTMQVFAEQAEIARKKASNIIDRAERRVESGENRETVYEETLKELNDYQDSLDHGWKGDGPIIIHEAKSELGKKLKIQ
jgi:tetratricopeptide (TPR) repeat protein